MVLKGTILPDHIPVNNYELLVLGIVPLTFTEISGLEEELETTQLPDRTVASGGNTLPVEFTAMQPMHHLIEVGAMEVWFRESQDPVLPTYKKAATILVKSISGLQTRSYALTGVFPKKRKTPDLEMANEGEAAMIEWTFSADKVLPLG